MSRTIARRPPTSATPLADPREPARGLGPMRTRVLGVLEDAASPTTPAEVASRLGGHVNTARFHLEALVADGLARRLREDRSVPGRPRVRYAASPAAPGGPRRSYHLLAEILTAHLAAESADPEASATAAGAAFGRAVATRDARASSAGAAVAAVVRHLEAIGFAPRATAEGDGMRIDMASCPFLEVATAHLPVVCAVHRGLMVGILEQLGAPLEVERLEPLVEPDRCIAHLARR